MLPAQSISRQIIPLALLISLLSLQAAAQQEAPQDSDDVVRVRTELVQTDVMVFDKQGRFIEDLTPAQFVLKVDGKPREISFFERVIAGSVNEDAQLAAARGSVRASGNAPTGVKPLDRGRTTVFFVDDLHLGPENLRRTKDSIARFIDNELGQNDEAVITSASGRIGFLQQVTNERAVLRAALQKLVYKPYSATDRDHPPMTEYQAIRIEQFDQGVLEYFIEQLIRDTPGMRRDTAESMVRARARSIADYGTSVTRNTLYSILSLVNSLGSYGGRKVLFLFSDGFYLNSNNSEVLDLIRRVTDQARRSSVVIYSLDSRGLVSAMPDASTEVAYDPTHRLDSSNFGEHIASQDGMSVLASDTGGRFLRNSNDLKTPVKKTLQETATYYLLAWKPEEVDGNSVKFRKIDITVPSRPDLVVRVRRGVFEREPESPRKPSPKKKKETSQPTVEDTLRGALGALVPPSDLPTALLLNYVDSPEKGSILTVAMEIAPDAVTLSPDGDKFRGTVSLAGVVMNPDGKQVTGFKDQLNITSRTKDSLVSAPRGLVYSFQSALKPGLYQVRIATFDETSKKKGGATQWLEVPDLHTGSLAMSTLMLAERHPTASANENPGGPITPGELSIDRRFNKTSYLRFLTVIYNARIASAPKSVPDLAVQVQLFRDNQPVLTTALRKVPVEGLTDTARVPYAAETNLAGLPPGEYVLTVTAIDRIAKTSASSRSSFVIE